MKRVLLAFAVLALLSTPARAFHPGIGLGFSNRGGQIKTQTFREAMESGGVVALENNTGNTLLEATH